MKMRLMKTLSVTILLLMVASWTQADLLMYTNKIEFLSQINAPYVDDFNDLNTGGDDLVASPLARSNGTYGYEISTIAGESFSASGGSVDGTAVSTLDSGFVLSLDNVSGGANAIGGEFFLTDDLGNKVTAAGLTITMGSETITVSSDTSSDHQFVGFIATGGDSLSALTVSTADVSLFNAADNIIVGAVAAIPEPATLGLISICGVAAIFIRRIFS